MDSGPSSSRSAAAQRGDLAKSPTALACFPISEKGVIIGATKSHLGISWPASSKVLSQNLCSPLVPSLLELGSHPRWSWGPPRGRRNARSLSEA